jgi:integrase/recombinase XerD
MPATFRFNVRKDDTRATSPWWVDIPARYSETGKRQKRFFPSKELAKGEVQRLKTRAEKHGTSAKLLTPATEENAARAVELLKSEGVGDSQLAAIVQEYIERKREREKSVTLLECWNSYISEKIKEGKRPAHIENLKRTCRRFAPLHSKMLPDITRQDLAACMAGLSASYHNLTLRELRSVLNYAMKGELEWLSANPAEKISFIVRKIGEVKIYTPSEIDRLFKTCRETDFKLIPALVMMTFCGVRPAHKYGEIVRLKWNQLFIHDTEPRIEVSSIVGKIEKRRQIPLRPTALIWLSWWTSNGGNPEGMIVKKPGEPFRDALQTLFKRAGIARHQDALRKSFASYLAKTETKDTAIKDLGHSGGQLLDRHYRTDVTMTEAKAFWAILPPPIEGATITNIKNAAA